MDAYLDIARMVLTSTRRPMSARAILKLAYDTDLVPHHLYGKTQHKTLQARLSEDILIKRERSLFFRTAPGRFFLRELLSDPSVPDEYKTPMVARRRTRQLQRGPVLSFFKDDLMKGLSEDAFIETTVVENLIKEGKFSYIDPRYHGADRVIVWSFVIVYRDDMVLSYRLGNYREDRDSFLNKRTIGFFTTVCEEDSTLFHSHDLGISSSGVLATKIDLDIIFDDSTKFDCDDNDTSNFYFINKDDTYCLIGVTNFHCPDWFDPHIRKLAINDLVWIDISVIPNHLEDFEPWTKKIFERHNSLLSWANDKKKDEENNKKYSSRLYSK